MMKKKRDKAKQWIMVWLCHFGPFWAIAKRGLFAFARAKGKRLGLLLLCKSKRQKSRFHFRRCLIDIAFYLFVHCFFLQMAKKCAMKAYSTKLSSKFLVTMKN
jgi:hypothetical protein